MAEIIASVHIIFSIIFQVIIIVLKKYKNFKQKYFTFAYNWQHISFFGFVNKILAQILILLTLYTFFFQ